MVDPEIIRKRLARLDGYLVILERQVRYDLDTFMGDPEHYGSAEHFLQLSIQILIDLGQHVVADNGLGTIGSAGEVPDILLEHRILSPELAKAMQGMIGFRNVLVHEYEDVDHQLVHENLSQRLVDFHGLREAFAQLL